ncbi:2-phosphosulfolactate phosphatase [Nocardia sp. NBC_00403]|uniref:2-phosphosulfolactate phosphatase n=1 Tax=Nocardia sp. NBC_00403 TaxID=2975990 RepID=UPI002E24B731
MSGDEWFGQRSWGVRFEWGVAGALALAPGSACVVIVDVLSFTTSVSVAVEAGTEVIPYPWRNDSAAEFAERHNAEVAVGRRAVSAQQPWSLSPAALRRAPTARRLVLPSPNGSAIAAAVAGVPVVAGSLRNADAVAAWIHRQGWGTPELPVTVIAAGEHWPGQPVLRPAVEDLLGAGAIIHGLNQRGASALSPEALVAEASYTDVEIATIVIECSSGRELTEGGFAEDVAIATELDTTDVVPLLVDGVFIDGRRR